MIDGVGQTQGMALETQKRMTIETLDVTTLETQRMRLETQRM